MYYIKRIMNRILNENTLANRIHPGVANSECEFVSQIGLYAELCDTLEDKSAVLQPLGLQQLILDVHFTVEIARFAGYPSRHVHQIASAIIARAIRTFSGRGIDPQRALPEDEWFVETAKAAINKLLMGASGSDTSEIDEEHIILHDDEGEEVNSDSDESPSSLSTVTTFQSFASAEAEELESPGYLTDPET